MKYRKEGKKVFSLNFHLIFVVKYRQKVFVDGVGIIERVKELFENISKDFKVEVIEQECGEDYIHLVISTRPELDIPNYINILKGHSSRALRKEFKDFFKNKLSGDSFWSPSYFIATTGNVSLDELKKYVEDQRKKLKEEE